MPVSSSGRLGPRLLATAALSAALAGAPASAAPPGDRPGAAAERARRALAARDVPFEPHAFFSAAAEGDLDLVDLFLDAGMPAPTRDAWGNSALLEAARNDRPGVVERLLARGSKPGDAPGGEPPLAVAAESGSLEALAALLGAGADPDQPADPSRGPGGTPLQRACAAEAWEAARLLLEGGASPGLPAPPLPPPLCLAAESGHAPTVALLLAKGADPNARAPGGTSPLALAVPNGHVEVVRLLLLGGAGTKAERAALLKGRPVRPEIRKLLLSPPKRTAPRKAPR